MREIVRNIAVVLLITSCSASRFVSKDFQGIYVQEQDSNFRLAFNGDSFSYVDRYNGSDLALYSCCDSITYGNWSLDNTRHLLYLNTPEYLNSSFVGIHVKEKIIQNEGDTLCFVLNSPLEQYFKKYGGRNRDFYYKVTLYSSSCGLLANYSLNQFETNVIKIPKPLGTLVDKFSISVYPKGDFGGRNIGTREVTTFEYKIENNESNYFDVDIPYLSLGYLVYRRLYKDVVIIVNKDLLEWDNQLYKKR